MTPPLRPYQQAALDALRRHVSAGKRRLLLTAMTGSGKTVLASAIIHSARKRSNARVLFFAHRLELVDQTVRQLGRWGVHEIGVLRADDPRTNRLMPIQIATVQTLSRRDLPPAGLVFVDEAHRAAGDSYRRILDAYPEAIIIGLTATPCRLDGKPLGDIFEVLEVSATYKELMADGFVIEPIVYSARVQPDLSRVHTRAGDFAEDELEIAVNQPHVIGDLVDEWRRHAEGRRTVVFACTIAHSKNIVARFLDAGVRAEHLDGTTPEDERAAILARLDRHETELVCNVGVLTEGWDQPSVKCIILARPTQSLSLYMQMAGRALRPWSSDPGEPSVIPILLDHGANVDRHGLPQEDRDWSLAERPRKPERSTHRVCPGCFAYVQKNPCELCGFERVPEPREIREEPGQLERRTPEDVQRAFFLSQLERARNRAFKPGFAAAKYKEKFGSWPPWGWSEEAKRLYAEDTNWQERNANREAERAYWNNINAPPPMLKETDAILRINDESEPWS